MSPTLPSILEATLILSDQFNSTLSTPLTPAEPQPASSTTNSSNPAAPLPLLSTSAAALKAQTTKLSLLSINTPFTPSALITVLSTVNESVLPSLVTAALLTIPAEYTRAFHAEAKLLVKDALRELGSLVGVVKVIASGGAGSGDKVVVTEQQKVEVMACTGRVWKACEQLVSFAEEGVVGFVAAKAKQYLELVRDGIRELEEWDPEAEGGDDDDDPFWDDEAGDYGDELISEKSKETGTAKGKERASYDDDDDDDDDESNDNKDTTIANLKSEKSHILRLLNPIAQIYPAIISQRLKKKTGFPPSTSKDQQPQQHGLSASQISQLDRLMPHLRELPNLVDEAAGSLYDQDIDNAVMYTIQLRQCAFAAAEVARLPLGGNTNANANMPGKEGRGEKGEKNLSGEGEDKFPKWVDTWMGVVEEIARSKVKGEAP
ncbi:hypothetical protein AJ78_03979 [Emergomyces pasteurianus Ep9510]|uniref:Cyclin-D1-binding protein 1-like N-terminal domain-containing protein n=1 Tax=Emergomyces pasteurianus Ep9510 TaxID=1447872 RepID=A0A1J9QI17_9EURO|nr:hypothetical protein AJ78_03979 [Emergomyces pasteurianus Ep9510]